MIFPIVRLLTKVTRRPWAPSTVLEFAIKTRYVLDSWKTSCCPKMFSGVLENSWIVFKLFIFELLITLNIQESRKNNVNEQNNVWICFILSIFSCVVKRKLFKIGCVIKIRYVYFWISYMVSLTWLAHTSKLAEKVKVATDARRNVSRRAQRRHFAYQFQVVDVATQTDVHKMLYCLYTTKKMSHESTHSIRIYVETFFKWSCIRICHKGILFVIRYRFCWIGAYPHNWVWNGPELSINTFAVLSLVCACWTELTSEIFCPNCFLPFAYQKCFFFVNFLLSTFESTFYK